MYFLEDEVIGLRTLMESDGDGAYSTWFDDKIVCQFNSHHRYPKYRNEIKEFIQLVSRDHSQIVLAIVDKESGRHIGNISLQQIDNINNQCEIAFIIGEKEFWGRGYATKAAKLMINHAFKELNLQRIYFGTADNNFGMQKVGDKLGFVKEGEKRKALYKNGEYHNIYEYSLLREEWETSMN